jgi:N-methylhydantoinase B/oxoprolinase/acetone carboxylase alpha subunit
MRGGEMVADVLSILLANVRTPVEREGDLAAQIAANRTGEKRLREIVRKYGLDETLLQAAEMQRYAERMMRATLADLPDGTYEFEDFLDDDGITDDPIRIRAAVTIAGDRATVDFTGSAPQTTGGVNANFAMTLAGVVYCFRCLIEEDVPYNAGISKPISVIAPEGTIVNARRPAAVAGGNVETSQRITDVVFGALARALPHRVQAASQGTMNNITLGGTDPRTGEPFAYYETLAGGMGGRAGKAGLSGVHTHMSNTRNTPVEAIEQYLPLKITKYARRTGSGGAGAAAGGDGLVREYEMLTETEVTVISDRRKTGPYGLNGGESGATGRNTLVARGKEKVLPGKFNRRFKPGERLRIETPGGGGYGAE